MAENAQNPLAAGQQCYCSLDELMSRLSRNYALQVLCVVDAMQPVRYSEIESTIGEISSSTLAARLRELTDRGLLEREQHETIPPQVEYTLTDDGEALGGVLEPLLGWIETSDRAEL